MRKELIIGVFILVLAVIGLVVVLTKDETTPSTNNQENAPTEVTQQAPQGSDATEIDTALTIGNEDAPVTIVEYVDYKCPNCNRFHRGTAEEIDQEYISTGKAKFDIRPISYIGPDSERAGAAVYCAAEQNMLSAMHDAILDYMWGFYESGDYSTEFEDILTSSKLSQLASDAGLDGDTLEVCLGNGEANTLVQANANRATEDEVQGTPGFVINGQKFSGLQPFSVFKTLIDVALRG